MKLLIDKNLPIQLGGSLRVEAMHATDLGRRLTDDQIWHEAKRQGCVLVTKDADFFDRMALTGPPPKVIWVRFGNMRRNHVVELFIRGWKDICGLLEVSDLVEVFQDRLEGISFSR